jgi:anti-sigma-K factor RskA
MRAYLDTTLSLAMAVPQVEPSPRLKESIQARIQPARLKPALGERLMRWWRSLSPAWGLAALALVLVLVAGNIILWTQGQSLARQQAAMASQFQVVALVGTQAQPDATGVVVISHDGDSGTLTVDGLMDLPQEKQYQLWLIKDGKRTSGGVFSVDEKGYAALMIYSPLPLKDYSGFGITIEPAGGSPGPTGAKVLGSKS